MNKRDYKITPVEMSFGITYKTEMWDEYENYSCVYERSIEEAMTYAKNWCKDADDRKRRKEITNRAIQEMIALDRMAGITTAMSDGLD